MSREPFPNTSPVARLFISSLFFLFIAQPLIPTVQGVVVVVNNDHVEIRNIIINKVPVQVTQSTATVSSRDILEIHTTQGGQTFATFGNTWTFFGLKPEYTYYSKNWAMRGECGASTQSCDKECKGLEKCEVWSQNGKEPGILTWLDSHWNKKGHQFCSGLSAKSEQNYTLYELKPISTIALTSYGGPFLEIEEPGYTVSSVAHSNNYAHNAVIAKINPVNDDEKILGFAESTNEVFPMEELVKEYYLSTEEQNPQVPEFVVDRVNSQCHKSGWMNGWAPNIQGTLKKGIVDRRLSGQKEFKPFIILRNPSKLPNMFNTLIGKNILTARGIRTWKNTNTFEYLDPCNQLFLTLRIDAQGNYYVRVPGGAAKSFSADEGMRLCIAVQEPALVNDPQTSRELILYSALNGTKMWTNSSAFRGLLSPDYVESVELELTISANVQKSEDLFPKLLNVSVETDSSSKSSPTIKIATTKPAHCEMAISKTCSLSFETTTWNSLSETKHVDPSCGSLYERISYNCDGVIGFFNLPVGMTEFPIRDYSAVPVQSKDVILYNNTPGFHFSFPFPSVNVFKTKAFWIVLPFMFAAVMIAKWILMKVFDLLSKKFRSPKVEEKKKKRSNGKSQKRKGGQKQEDDN